MKYDPLIYGKDQTERIVSIEVDDDKASLFIENEDGTVDRKIVDNRFWLLSSKKIDKNWIKLKGSLSYKYGIQFNTEEEYLQYKKKLKPSQIYTLYNKVESLQVKDGYTYFKGMVHDEVSVLSFDIEATGLQHDENSRVLIISNTFRKKGKITRKLFCFDEYQNEGEMIKNWCDWVRKINPSLILGHNIFSYDLPYLSFVASKYDVELKLGRDGSAIKYNDYESKFRKDATQFYHYKKCHVYGRELIDTLFLAIKYDVGRKYESYGLKSIIDYEGLEVKDRQHYDASQIRFKYKDPEEWEKIKQYALHDADDSLALYDLMSPPFFYLTQSVPKPYQLMIESASGSQINSVMVRSYLQEAHSLPRADKIENYEGGLSFGNPGIYDNVFKIDVASLYPSIMLQYEVYDKNKDPMGNFKNLVTYFTRERLKNKKLAKDNKYHDDLQSAQKIFINSCYGFLGASGLSFNSPKKAAFITKMGREILRSAESWAIKKGFQIVNGDTDSISFNYPDGREFKNGEPETLLKEINEIFPEKIIWEDDGLFKKVIILKAKNYILYDGNKIKYKGSAVKASTKEPALKQFIKDIIDEMLNDTNRYVEVYDSYVREIMSIEDIKRWATRKTITDKVLNPKRTNEQKVLDAIEGADYTEGDRAYFFFKEDESLSLVENFDGNYNKNKLLEKLYKTSNIFNTIIPKETFKNYKLKRNQEELEKFIDNQV